MQVTLHSTTKIVQLMRDGKSIEARVWEGVSEKGVPCHAYITRIAVDRSEDAEEFDRDLQEHSAPSPPLQAIPLNLVL